MTTSIRTMLACAIVAAVTAAVIGGFFAAGSPQEARRRRLDDRRVSDLREVQSALNVYWTRTQKMPESIETALKDVSWSMRPVDPVTMAPYEYRSLGAGSYELCAVFDRASQETQAFAGDPFWSHSSGRQCFTLTMKTMAK